MKRTRINPINRKRKAELHARNFGDEAEAVRMLPCLCWARTCTWNRDRCRGDVVAAHVTARGMGGAKGGRLDLVPLCDAHHREAGEARTSEREAFESRYGLDLRAEADRLAAAQALPLGICGLAQRWAAFEAPGNEQLDTREWDALIGWVRRECEREAERRRSRRLDGLARGHDLGRGDPSLPDAALWPDVAMAIVNGRQRDAGVEPWDGFPDEHREALAAHVAKALGLDADLAEQLLDAAEVGHE